MKTGIKALEKTLFYFFWGWFSCVSKKMKVCFVRLAKIFVGGTFFLFFFVRLVSE
jgi:hypothetical protein